MDRRRIVLIVDDSRTARGWATLALRALDPEVEVLEAEDAQQAEAHLDRDFVDGMLVDLNMPGPAGFELVRRLSDRCPEAHVAILTANVQKTIEERAISYGFQFLSKPVNKDALVPFVAALDKTDEV